MRGFRSRKVRLLMPFGAMAAMAAMAATMVVAAPSGAQVPLKEYSATFEPNCVIAPGIFNLESKVRASLRAQAPESLELGQTFEAVDATWTITLPASVTEDFVLFGLDEVRGRIRNLVLDNTNAEPAKLNAAEPAEYLEGLPFLAPVEKEKALAFAAPALTLGEVGHTYSFGPIRATGAGSRVTETVDSAPGFEEQTEAGWVSTHEGIQFEIEGFKGQGERDLGPLEVACTAPAGVTVAEIQMSETPFVTSLSPNRGSFLGGTKVTISGINFNGATAVDFVFGTQVGTEKATPTVISNELITVVTPFSATQCTFISCVARVVVVTPKGSNEGETGSQNDFSYFVPEPGISSIEPTSGPSTGGTVVTIKGRGFSDPSVKFGSAVATDTEVLSEGEIRAVSPPGSGTVGVTVTINSGTPAQRTSGSLPFTYIPTTETAEYTDWTVSGSLTDRKLSQAITLPGGATFNGRGEVNTESAGSVSGTLSIPPFAAPFKLGGLVSAKLGLTLTPVGPLEGSVAKSETVSGDETLTAPVQLKLGISSVSLLGLQIPTRCSGSEPVSLKLVENLTREELLREVWSFAGMVTVPRLKCEGGLLGGALGLVLTDLLSGPENAYSIRFTAPGAG